MHPSCNRERDTQLLRSQALMEVQDSESDQEMDEGAIEDQILDWRCR
jgi:hypothetical protein